MTVGTPEESSRDMAGRGIRGSAGGQRPLGLIVLALSELHRRRANGTCEEDGKPYPCPTIQAVRQELDRGRG